MHDPRVVMPLTQVEACELATLIKKLAAKIYEQDRCGQTAFQAWCVFAEGIKEIPKQNDTRPPSRHPRKSA